MFTNQATLFLATDSTVLLTMILLSHSRSEAVIFVLMRSRFLDLKPIGFRYRLRWLEIVQRRCHKQLHRSVMDLKRLEKHNRAFC